MADPHSTGNYPRFSSLRTKRSHEEDERGLEPSLSFVLTLLPSVKGDPPPVAVSQSTSFVIEIYAAASSPPVIPLLSFPTHNAFSRRSRFIHSYFTASTAADSRTTELELFLGTISLCFHLHSSSFFLPLGIYFYLFLLHPALLPPSLPPSLRVLVPSRLFLVSPRS